MPTPTAIKRTYFTLLLGNTLAASLIWGINTIFLLDAGLNNLEAFAANAFFTAGMVVFEVPTGIVADMWGRRASFVLGTVTLAVTTALYVLLWEMEAPFWEWAAVSLLLGLGFTFFSGATEAWLVDALDAVHFQGALESVLARGQVLTGVGMLTGSIGGGYLAQEVSLGAPFVLRAAVLVVMCVLALALMRDIGFTPKRGGRPWAEIKGIAANSIEYGWRVPAVKYLMLAAPFTGGVGIYVFYALQPYLLELYGDPRAYGVAGPGGGNRRRVPDRRRTDNHPDPQAVSAPHVRFACGRGAERPQSGADRPDRELLGGDRPDRRLGPHVRRGDADSPGLPQWPDPVTATGDDPLLRLVDELQRRRGRATDPRPRRRRLGLSRLLSALRRDLGVLAAVHRQVAPAEHPGRPRRRGATGARRCRREPMSMTSGPDLAVRQAEPADAEVIGRLLHDFNSEFDEPTPGPRALAARVRELLATGETAVLLGGAGPDGLAVLRFRPALWTEALECYLAELYVVPGRRGQGLGRALMRAVIELARREGADRIELGTGEDDVAARALYESLGFSNREGKPDGPLSYFYERDL